MTPTRLVFTSMAAVALLSSGTSALARGASNGDMAATRAAAEAQESRYGHPSPGPADRTVVIGPDTDWINVTRLETVKIRYDGQATTWTFNTMGTRPFPLSKIVPGVEGVTVYVSEHPMYGQN